MKTHLTNLIKASYGCIYIQGFEEDRIVADIISVAKEMKKAGKPNPYEVWTWSITDGLSNGAKIPGTQDVLKTLDRFFETEDGDDGPEGRHIPNNSLLILKDFHAFMRGNPPPILVRRLKECIAMGRATNRHIIITGCQLHLPPELEKEIVVVEFSLPTREELKPIAEELAASVKQDLNGNTELILDAGCGLTTTEFSDACAYSVAEKGEINAGIINRIKAETIKKNGILEIIERSVTLDDIGGLDNLKASLFSARNCFTKAAKEYGLPSPRPLLMVGQPGCAKSLTAQATKTIFNLPLLRIEAGSLFGGTVGASEENWRRAFATAKAIAPCIVWVDEVDGLFAGAESSGQCDGGTTARVIKAILQDLQFNADGMLFVFTANDIDGLPDPLIDRCDVWSVDLPNTEEREAIWNIHIAKRKRNPKTYSTLAFANNSDGFSGRQIEQAWIKALTLAFNDNGREPVTNDVLAVLKEFVPTSKTMAEAIERRRKRLANCAKPATSAVEQPKAALKRKVAA